MYLNTTRRQSKQKICASIDHHWSTKISILFAQTNWVCQSDVWRFCENESDSSNWLWLESSHSVKNVTRLESNLHHFSTLLESSNQKSWLDRDSASFACNNYYCTENKLAERLASLKQPGRIQKAYNQSKPIIWSDDPETQRHLNVSEGHMMRDHDQVKTQATGRIWRFWKLLKQPIIKQLHS